MYIYLTGSYKGINIVKERGNKRHAVLIDLSSMDLQKQNLSELVQWKKHQSRLDSPR